MRIYDRTENINTDYIPIMDVLVTNSIALSKKGFRPGISKRILDGCTKKSYATFPEKIGRFINICTITHKFTKIYRYSKNVNTITGIRSLIVPKQQPTSFRITPKNYYSMIVKNIINFPLGIEVKIFRMSHEGYDSFMFYDK